MRNLNYSLEDFSGMISGNILQTGADTNIQNILIDSRKIGLRQGTVFFALKGDVHDGHNYIEALYHAGIKIFVISEELTIQNYSDASFIRVHNSIDALQDLAKEHRKKFKIPVVGITGSNAKTIVKEWIFDALFKEFKVVRSPKSYNSQVGVPLSVLNLSPENNMAIFEAGISKPGEMTILESIISPTIGIFTNIGSPHQENFSSLEQKAREKALLFKHSEKILYCRDHPIVHKVLRDMYPDQKLLCWSKDHANADLLIRKQEDGYQAQFGDDNFEINLPDQSWVDVENACHVLLLSLLLNLNIQVIKERISSLKPIAMRLEKLEGINGCTLINDSYNSDINSLSIALDYLLAQTLHQKNTLVLSDILESGKNDHDLYGEVIKILQSKNVDRLLGIGPAISASEIKTEFPNSEFYSSTDDFIRHYKSENFQDENILLKGARIFEFERIAELLQEQSHETVLEVNLDAMTHNLNYIRSLLNPDVKIMAMVKAFAYGSGSYDVARFLEYSGVEYLSVAYTDEGIRLRQEGISLPIMVLNPEISGYPAMIRNNLEPQIYSFRTLKAFNEALLKFEFGEGYPIHIMVNTGMNRLGFEPDEIDELISYLIEKDHIKTLSVFSHLAGSDEEAFDGYTKCQIELFDSILKKFIQKDFSPMGHILNSNGILRHNKAQYNMVRLGLALYGLTTHPDYQRALQPVSSLKTTISQIRTVKEGQGVGYTPKSTLKRNSQIATIPIGYADGLSRILGNGKGKVMVNGRKVPIVGNVCMDMTMIDVTGIPCSEGDSVEVFGKEQSIYTVAKFLETIPYEVLTNISERVKRVFIQE